LDFESFITLDKSRVLHTIIIKFVIKILEIS
jgi:hypothetical protein